MAAAEYGNYQSLRKKLRRDIESLREALIRAIQRHHPEPADVSADEIDSCRRFLQHFGRVFTTNYDLLLYWVIMEMDPMLDDGFRRPGGGSLRWTQEPTQEVYYLHGALFIHDSGENTTKLEHAGGRILDQVEHLIARNVLPLVVSEGNSVGKLRVIRRHAYLTDAYNALVASTGAIVTFGLAFHPQDQHICDAIARSGISALYVGSFRGTRSPDYGALNASLRSIWLARASYRAKGAPLPDLRLFVYDSATGNVWR